MDYLSRLLKVMIGDPRFKFHPNCKSLGLTHLMFADDLILFYKADPLTLKLLMETLAVFHNTAGLKANLHKSQVVIGGASAELQNRCIRVTGLQDTQFPLKYLGVPITTSQLTKIECSALIENITAPSPRLGHKEHLIRRESFINQQCDIWGLQLLGIHLPTTEHILGQTHEALQELSMVRINKIHESSLHLLVHDMPT